MQELFQANAFLHSATTEAPPRPRLIQFPSRQASEPSELLFTYGTLLRGQLRAAILRGEVFEGEASLGEAELWDTGFGFPALTLIPGCEGVVWGEVYRIIHPALWAELDRIENGLYRRETHRVHIPGKATANRAVLAQLYVANKILTDSEMTLIPSGRWLDADPD